MKEMKERIVPLTDDQFDRLDEDRRKMDQVGIIVSSTIRKLAESLARDDRIFWQQVERLAEARSRVCTVDWVNRCIVVKGFKSDGVYANEEARNG